MATLILQARMGSTRLPGKALRLMAGRPMLWYAVETLRHAPAVDRLVMAIPDGRPDDELAGRAAEWGIECVRGPEADVLARFHLAARAFPDDVYLRATGDNPLPDRENPGRTLRVLIAGGFDYACETGMPLGSVVEAFSRAALEKAQREATRADDREHVTLCMKRGGGFRAAFPPCPEDRRWPELRLTVDTAADFERAEKIVAAVQRGPGGPDFLDVIRHCRKPAGA